MLEWRQIGEKEFQAQNSEFDFHLRQESRTRWVLDIFDVNISDPDKAWQDSQTFLSEEQAKIYASDL